MSKSRLPIVPLTLLMSLLLAGCGQRGPLYLPDKDSPAVAPAEAAPPADALEKELDEEDDLDNGNLKSDSFEDDTEGGGSDAP
jgi:predicted small lipoprotein YifL